MVDSQNYDRGDSNLRLEELGEERLLSKLRNKFIERNKSLNFL